MPMECGEDGSWTYRPRPKPAPVQPASESAVPTTTTTTNSLGEALLAEPAPVEAVKAVGEHGEEEDVDQRGLLVSFLVLCLSIPALIGAWCWPALVIGLVSGTVSASARSLGHVISFWITLFLMFVVFCVLGKEAFWGPRSYAPCKERFGPLAVFVFAALLIMVDPSVHLMGDTRAWPWCGNNAQFDRINDTAGWNAQCDASSTHYVCTIACCVSTWQNTSAADDTSYGWLPPSADFYSGPDSGPIPGPFGTLRPDGSVYTPAGSGGPFMLYTATTERPLVFYETGEVNPLQGGRTEADCKPYGVNPQTGYCYMTNVSLPYEEQLAQLGQYGMALADPTQPFDATSNNYVCGCDGCTPHEDFGHLSIVGVLSAIVCTYVGFLLLAVAVGWNANILGKLKKIGDQWAKLRGAARKRQRVTAEANEFTPATVP